MDLAGKQHPVSGVMFDAEGFPIFDSYFDMYLLPEDFLKSRETHFSRASKDLYSKILSNPELGRKFTAEEIELFRLGKKPSRFTWHHHQDSGRMQLVDFTQHQKTGHTGGYTVWGPGN